MADQFLTTTALARRVGMPARTLRYWARRGHLRAMRTPGGSWRFPLTAVEAVLRDFRPDGREPISKEGI